MAIEHEIEPVDRGVLLTGSAPSSAVRSPATTAHGAESPNRIKK